MQRRCEDSLSEKPPSDDADRPQRAGEITELLRAGADAGSAELGVAERTAKNDWLTARRELARALGD